MDIFVFIATSFEPYHSSLSSVNGVDNRRQKTQGRTQKTEDRKVQKTTEEDRQRQKKIEKDRRRKNTED